MCECVEGPGLIAGWACHGCRWYNGLQRVGCRGCGAARCKPLAADKQTGRAFETYEEAYAGDSDTLARINEQLRATAVRESAGES